MEDSRSAVGPQGSSQPAAGSGAAPAASDPQNVHLCPAVENCVPTWVHADAVACPRWEGGQL